MDKKTWRKKMLEKRNALTREQLTEAEEAVVPLFFEEPSFLHSSLIYLYASIGSEVPTGRLIKECLKNKIRVALPVVISAAEMEFREITGMGDLKTGFHGVPEPRDKCRRMEEPGYMILPGLAFDEKNNRLGYGGGYYDRYLKTHAETKFIKTGLCYTFQKLPLLPAEVYDEKVHQVICIPCGS